MCEGCAYNKAASGAIPGRVPGDYPEELCEQTEAKAAGCGAQECIAQDAMQVALDMGCAEGVCGSRQQGMLRCMWGCGGVPDLWSGHLVGCS